MKNTTAESSTGETPKPETSSDTGEVVDAVTTDPTAVTVQVSNSTGQDGLGATAVTELQQHGFNVADTRRLSVGPLSSTTVYFSPGNEQAAATVASAFADPTIERVSGKGNTVQVVLGADFNAVKPPQPSGSAVQVHVLHHDSGTPTQLPEDLSVTNAADTSCE